MHILNIKKIAFYKNRTAYNAIKYASREKKFQKCLIYWYRLNRHKTACEHILECNAHWMFVAYKDACIFQCLTCTTTHLLLRDFKHALKIIYLFFPKVYKSWQISRYSISFQFNQDLYSSSSGVPLTSSSASASSHSPCSPILPPSIAINAAQTASTTIPTIGSGGGGGGGNGVGGIGAGSGNISAVHHQHRSVTKEEDSVNRHSDNEGITVSSA